MAATTKSRAHGRPGHGARRLRGLWATTIGKKWMAAITGITLALYIVAHMLGNLKAVQGNGGGDGEPAIDAYAEWLRNLLDGAIPHGGIVWAVRVVLVVALVLHVTAVTQLWLRNRAARPRSQGPKRIRSTIAAQTMVFSGFVLLAFVVFHILHFTTRTIHPTPLESGKVYAGMHGAFQEWWLVALYLVAAALVGLHLHHGLWSAAQTGGIDNPYRNLFWRRTASVVTAAVVIGFAAVPVLFLADALPEPQTQPRLESFGPLDDR